MSSHRLKQILIAFVAVLVLWGLAEMLGGGGGDDVSGDFSIARLTRAEVDSVVIGGEGDTVVLSRTAENRWLVNGHDASPSMMDQLFDALGDTAMNSELAARSAGSHARMGVDSASAKLVRLVAGGRTAKEFYVGGRGSRFGTIYVRDPGDDRVFLLESGLANLVEREVDGWRRREIVAVSPDSVTAVEVQGSRGTYALRKGAEGWTVSGAPADSAAVQRMLERYRALRANAFPTPAQVDSVDFDAPDLQVRLRGMQGQTLAALLLDSLGSNYLVKTEDSPAVYQIATWALSQMVPADTALLADGR